LAVADTADNAAPVVRSATGGGAQKDRFHPAKGSDHTSAGAREARGHSPAGGKQASYDLPPWLFGFGFFGHDTHGGDGQDENDGKGLLAQHSGLLFRKPGSPGRWSVTGGFNRPFTFTCLRCGGDLTRNLSFL